MLTLEILEYELTICRLAVGPVPEWALQSQFFSITLREDAELSVVCESSLVPPGMVAEPQWRAFAVQGPLDFGITGILADLSGVLAATGVSIFAISTYDTDVILVRAIQLEEALDAIRDSGHRVIGDL